MAADARIRSIEAFMQTNLPNAKIVDTDNIYTGPYAKRTLTKNAFVEFRSAKDAKAALASLSLWTSSRATVQSRSRNRGRKYSQSVIGHCARLISSSKRLRNQSAKKSNSIGKSEVLL